MKNKFVIRRPNRFFLSLRLLSLPVLFAVALWGAAPPAEGDAFVNTCAPSQSVTAGSYIVQTDYWNQPNCPGSQCMNIDTTTGAFSVTQATYSCGYNVAAYPDILYGCAFGSCSPNSALPAQVSSLQCVMSNWSFTPTNTGAWDAAYDIWLCPDNTCGSSGFNGGAEVMIWLDWMNTNGWEYDMGPVTIEGMGWEVWQYESTSGSEEHQYVAYLAKTPVTFVTNLDIKPFLNDSQSRGYLQSSWYLYAVEAGSEIHYGGIPFTSNSFTVSVNQGCAGTPTPTPVFAPTATPVPSVTFSTTATPAASQGSWVLYPNPVKTGDPAHIHLNLNSTSDVKVKVFTMSNRKILDKTFFQAASGQDLCLPIADKNGNVLADGLYYIVVEAEAKRSILKLLILR